MACVLTIHILCLMVQRTLMKPMKPLFYITLIPSPLSPLPSPPHSLPRPQCHHQRDLPSRTEGSDIVLECLLNDGTPADNATWLFGDQPVAQLGIGNVQQVGEGLGRGWGLCQLVGEGLGRGWGLC